MLGNQRQALDARAKLFHASGTVRTAAPATCFTLPNAHVVDITDKQIKAAEPTMKKKES